MTWNPTAMALLAELASTPSSTLAPPAVLGLVDRVHAVPFQRSIRVSSREPVNVCPTAQALPAEVAVTENRSLLIPAAVVGATCQEVPSQCSIRFCAWLLPVGL